MRPLRREIPPAERQAPAEPAGPTRRLPPRPPANGSHAGNTDTRALLSEAARRLSATPAAPASPRVPSAAVAPTPAPAPAPPAPVAATPPPRPPAAPPAGSRLLGKRPAKTA